ncbi:protein of unknown function [Vibrio tapetis subsp. tapetis]|uniref:Uncharacterized protein n=1 Tax=Vibrio tapetis subsp. tapetis TaxID=1671868 RepID=A0A2N8ZLK4_9VIBR|nr:protein of unknown function [Vibrio tapetis subsp. tapetis]
MFREPISIDIASQRWFCKVALAETCIKLSWFNYLPMLHIDRPTSHLRNHRLLSHLVFCDLL